jgi:hypothetical protein
MTKQEAVRQALSERGNDAMPKQIQGFVQERFRIAMTTNHISTAKGDILRKGGGKGKSIAKKPQVQPSTAAPAKRAGIPLEDMLAIKDLVGRLGAKPVWTLIDAFAK